MQKSPPMSPWHFIQYYYWAIIAIIIMSSRPVITVIYSIILFLYYRIRFTSILLVFVILKFPVDYSSDRNTKYNRNKIYIYINIEVV